MGCHFLFPGTFLTQGLNTGLLHWQADSLLLSRLGSPEVKVKVLVAQWCPTRCNSMSCSLPGSSVPGILQARILEWIVIPFSRGTSRIRDGTRVSYIAGRFLTLWTTREGYGKDQELSSVCIKCAIQMGRSGSQLNTSVEIRSKSQARNTNSWVEQRT